MKRYNGEKHTVMFTACCGWPTCGTITSLRNTGTFRVIGVDCSPNPCALNYVDELIRVPRVDDPSYIDELIDICVRKNVDLLVPLISDEINVISDNAGRFAQHGVKVLLSDDGNSLKIANNKMLLQKEIEEAGFGDLMPKSIMVDKDNIEDALYELGYPGKPVCLKCTDACGSAGFRIVDDRIAKIAVFARSRKYRSNPYVSKKQLMDAIENIDPSFMLQEYLPGEELGTMCLVDHGRTVYSPSHRNISMEFSTAVYCELVNDEEANRIVRKINKLLNLDGNIGYDFKRDETGKLRLMEINPRISATVSLAAKAGLNLVELGCLHALGYEIDESIEPEYGLRLMRVYGSLYEKDGVPYGRM